jgi:SAM-dependent methyltransferase
MSLQDIDQMEEAVQETARVLEPGGRLVIAITHPLITAGRFADDDSTGSPPPFVIDGSWFERRALVDTRERAGLTMTFHSEHRPLQAYTSALAAAGFLIDQLGEVANPDPSSKWHRIPMFLHLRALRR